MSKCRLCDNPSEFKNGGWTCLKPFSEAKGSVCEDCTRDLVCVWARENKRKNMPVNTPDPTNSPAGAGTAFAEQLAAVA